MSSELFKVCSVGRSQAILPKLHKLSFCGPFLVGVSEGILECLFKVVKALKYFLCVVVLFFFFILQVVPKGRFKLCQCVSFEAVFSEDNLVVVGLKLEGIMLKVGSALGEKSLEGPLVSFIGAGLIHLIGLGLLGNIKAINFLLEESNLVGKFLGAKAGVVANVGGGGSLRCHCILILRSRYIYKPF